MGKGGFEPPNSKRGELQSPAIDHSATFPKKLYKYLFQIKLIKIKHSKTNLQDRNNLLQIRKVDGANHHKMNNVLQKTTKRTNQTSFKKERIIQMKNNHLLENKDLQNKNSILSKYSTLCPL